MDIQQKFAKIQNPKKVFVEIKNIDNNKNSLTQNDNIQVIIKSQKTNKALLNLKYEWARTNPITNSNDILNENSQNFKLSGLDIGCQLSLIVSNLREDKQDIGQVEINFNPIQMESVVKRQISTFISSQCAKFGVHQINLQQKNEGMLILSREDIQLTTFHDGNVINHKLNDIVLTVNQGLENQLELKMNSNSVVLQFDQRDNRDLVILFIRVFNRINGQMEDNIDLNKVDILMLLSDVNYKMKAGLNDSLSMTDSKMSDVSSNDQMINKLKKKLKEFKSNNELLTISLNSTKNKIEIYENQKRELESQIELIKQENISLKEAINSQPNEQISKLNQLLLNEQSKVKQLMDELNNYKSTSESNSKLSNSQISSQLQNEEKSIVWQELDKVRRENISMWTKHSEEKTILQKENDSIRTDILEHKKKINSQQLQILDLQNQLSLNSNTDEIDQLKREKKKLFDELERIQKEQLKIQQKWGEERLLLHKELDQANFKFNDSINEIEILKNKMNLSTNSNSRSHEFDLLNHEIDYLKQQKMDLIQQIDKLRDDYCKKEELLKEDISNSLEKINNLLKEQDNLKNQLTRSETKAKQKEFEFLNLENDFNLKKDELEFEKIQNVNLQRENRNKNEQNTLLQQDLAQLKEKYKKKRETLAQTHTEHKQAKENLVFTKKQHDKTREDLNQLVQEKELYEKELKQLLENHIQKEKNLNQEILKQQKVSQTIELQLLELQQEHDHFKESQNKILQQNEIVSKSEFQLTTEKLNESILKIQQLEQEISLLKNQLKESQDQLNQKIKEEQANNENINEINSKYQDVLKKIHELKQEIQNYQEEIEQLKNQHHQKHSKLQGQEEEVNRILKLNEENLQKNKQLTNANEALTFQIKEIENRMIETTLTYNEVSNRLKAKENEIDILNQTFKTREQQLSEQFQRELKEFQDKYSNWEVDYQNKQKNIKDKERGFENEKESLKMKYDELKEKLEKKNDQARQELEDQLDAMKSDLKKIKSENSHLKESIKDHLETNEIHEKQIQKLANKSKDQEQLINQYENELRTIKDVKREIEGKLHETQKDLHRIKIQVQDYEQLMSFHEEKIRQTKQMYEKQIETNHNINLIEKERVQQYLQETHKLSLQLQNIEKELMDLKRENKILKAQIGDMESKADISAFCPQTGVDDSQFLDRTLEEHFSVDNEVKNKETMKQQSDEILRLQDQLQQMQDMFRKQQESQMKEKTRLQQTVVEQIEEIKQLNEQIEAMGNKSEQNEAFNMMKNHLKTQQDKNKENLEIIQNMERTNLANQDFIRQKEQQITLLIDEKKQLIIKIEDNQKIIQDLENQNQNLQKQFNSIKDSIPQMIAEKDKHLQKLQEMMESTDCPNLQERLNISISRIQQLEEELDRQRQQKQNLQQQSGEYQLKFDHEYEKGQKLCLELNSYKEMLQGNNENIDKQLTLQIESKDEQIKLLQSQLVKMEEGQHKVKQNMLILLEENNEMKQKIHHLEEIYQQDKQSSSFDESFEQ